MMNKSFLLAAACWMACFLQGKQLACAQQKPTILFKHLNMETGLSDPSTRVFHQDKQGFLWIGTENGLNRFDGTNTRIYQYNPGDSAGISGDLITNIIEDQHGDLLIGTQKALSAYHYAADNFSTFAFRELPAPERNHYSFPFFIDHLHQIWVYLAGNVYVYSPKDTALTYVTDYSNGYLFVNQPFYSPLKQLVSRGSKGIYINDLAGKKVKRVNRYFMNDPLATGPVSQIGQVHFDGDSLLWLASDSGLFVLNPANSHYVQYDHYTGKKGFYATSLVPYPHRPWLLVGTIGDGILLFDKVSRRFIGQYKHVPNDPLSLSGNSISTLYIDKNKNLFVGVGGAGVDYTNLDRVQFNRYFTKEDANALNVENNVSAIFQDKNGNIWCGTNASGILVYNQDMSAVLRRELPGMGIARMMAVSADEVLVCMINGTYMRYQYSTRLFTRLQATSSLKEAGSDAVNQLVRMPDSTWIACTESGLARVKRQGPHGMYLELDSMANKAMMWPNVQRLILLKAPWVLLQTYYTNLYLYKYEQGTFSMVREIGETPFYNNGSICLDSSVYMATSAGLMRFDTQHMQFEDRPLIPVYCTGIVADKRGHLWVSSTNGLHFYDPKTKRYKHYGSSDGLQGMTFNRSCLIKCKDGRIIAGGPNGVNMFYPDSIKDFSSAFQVKITDISVNDVPYNNAGNPLVNPPLILNDDQNTISLTFTPIDYVNPERQAITYQMLPYDDTPVTVTGKQQVRYPQMPPGNYRFVLSARGSTQKTILHIIIHPPYWKTWWFISASLILVTCLVFAAIKIYINWIKNIQRMRLRLMIRSQEDERKRIARDLHDDFGARLSALKLYMQAAGKKKANTALAIQQQSAQFIDQAIAELRNILFNLSPKTLEENGLAAALHELTETVNKLTLMELHLDTEAFVVKLKNTCEYAIYRVCQELINNSIKHAGATNIYLSLVSRKDAVVILYEDDGKGFNPAEVTRGYGINNIETHVQAIKGQLVIDSSPGKGLAVTITLPPSAIERHKKSQK